MIAIRHKTKLQAALTAGAVFALVFLFALVAAVAGAAENTAAHFHDRIEPILETYCYGCHAHGAHEGGPAFDEYKSDGELVGDVKTWLAVLKNVRSNVMPPPEEERPTDAERRELFAWIEQEVFKFNPADPDPGRVTLRRLNRVEYRNTIRDLTGIDYNTTDEFPPDDSGYGFDNIGDALSLSPLLMEKYITAARTIVTEAVPAQPPNETDAEAQRSYRRIFIDGPPPADAPKRDAYAEKLLAAFVRRAYRRPADTSTVKRLCELAKSAYTIPEQTFEAGISTALVAVLSSPRFLYRVEEPIHGGESNSHPLVDEFALASRLSYFLWSTMPDDELLQLAERSELRANMSAQVARMLKDDRSKALAENFAGQWLRARDVEHLDIDPIGTLGLQPELEEIQQQLNRLRQEREAEAKRQAADAPGKGTDRDGAHDQRWQEREKIRARARELRIVGEMFDTKLRTAMRDETEQYFAYIVHEDRDVLEFIDSDYTFLNETLAKHYGIPEVKGDEMRRVALPADSPRGGVLTQATFLSVTSNPNRTSPVKRGLFVLDNILGSPPPPAPPPNVPVLEAASQAVKGHRATVRELLEVHRRDAACAACHARMDPLGLAMENFNALGMWREKECEQPIDATGTLLTGEKFNGIRELKVILKNGHRLDFYRCLTEKLLTYATGRGLEYYDEATVDGIVARLDQNSGKFSALLMGIIESAPFQKQRRPETVTQN